jgi:4-hydroxybenzoate polyprenyltransferase
MLFYAAACALWALAAWLAGAHWPFWIALAATSVHLAWQVATLVIDDPDNCLVRFKANRMVGWLLTLGLAADILIATRAL